MTISRTTLLASVFLAIAPLTGCYATHEPGGSIMLIDSGPDVRDGGGPIRRDGGPPPPIDAGGPVACSTETVEPWAGDVACSEDVNECMRSCVMGGPDGCIDECIGAEPECQRCFYQTLIACSNDGGCLDEWRSFACCTEREGFCAGFTGFERLSCADACPAEIEEYSFCLNDRAEMCFFVAADNCSIRIEG